MQFSTVQKLNMIDQAVTVITVPVI